eukprot:SAG31_NODE_3786_length_3882_cov_2.127941_3_plen_248_part_00
MQTARLSVGSASGELIYGISYLYLISLYILSVSLSLSLYILSVSLASAKPARVCKDSPATAATARRPPRRGRWPSAAQGLGHSVGGHICASIHGDTFSISALHLAIKVPYFSDSGHRNEKVTPYQVRCELGCVDRGPQMGDVGRTSDECDCHWSHLWAGAGAAAGAAAAHQISAASQQIKGGAEQMPTFSILNIRSQEYPNTSCSLIFCTSRPVLCAHGRGLESAESTRIVLSAVGRENQRTSPSDA